MRRSLLTIVAILGSTASSAIAQTYDELLRENQELRARVATLEQHQARLGDGHAEGHADNHEHADEFDEESAHGHGNGKDHCKPHFDYCCPYEDHHGGHGHCDLCGCEPGAGEENGHAHGHAHGPAYHHSIEGYPLLHGARTEFFFVERHLHFAMVDTRGADGSEVDELEFEAEIAYAISDRVLLIAALPVICLDPNAQPNTAGVGDAEFGFRFMAFNGERDGLLFGLNVTTPTGDDDRGLGGDTLLQPSANWVHDFGCGAYMFNVVTWEMPVDVEEVEDLIRHDLVLHYTFLETADAPCFRFLTPGVEVNTESIINGPASGDTVVDVTLGLTWVVGEEDEIAMGWSFPVSGDRNFDDQFLFNFIKHL